MAERIRQKSELRGHEVWFDRDWLVSRTLGNRGLSSMQWSVSAVSVDHWVTSLAIARILRAHLTVFATVVQAVSCGSFYANPSPQAKSST